MTLHIGRSWPGQTHIEDRCPCPQEPCGLVASDRVLETCDEHALKWGKTIRQGHEHTRCPGGDV